MKTRMKKSDLSEGYLSNRVKELLAERGMSGGELAELANVSLDTVRSLTRNTQALPIAGPLVARLSKTLGVTPLDLFKWNDPVPTRPQPQGFGAKQ